MIEDDALAVHWRSDIHDIAICPDGLSHCGNTHQAEQLGRERKPHKLELAVYPQLLIDVGQVRLHCARADVQLDGARLVVRTFAAYDARHLLLSRS
jgi:hypothetical protein